MKWKKHLEKKTRRTFVNCCSKCHRKQKQQKQKQQQQQISGNPEDVICLSLLFFSNSHSLKLAVLNLILKREKIVHEKESMWAASSQFAWDDSWMHFENLVIASCCCADWRLTLETTPSSHDLPTAVESDCNTVYSVFFKHVCSSFFLYDFLSICRNA